MKCIDAFKALMVLGVLSVAAAQSDSSAPTPVPLTPPAQQTQPAPQPGVRFEAAPALTITKTAVLTPAEPAEKVMLWGGLSSELLLVPGLQASLSVPLSQSNGLKVLLRGSAEVFAIPYVTLGGDLLLTSAGGHFYGGPSAAVVLGGHGGWLAGGLLGYRNSFGSNSKLGYYFEGKLRYLVLKDAVMTTPEPGNYSTSTSDFTFPSPGLRMGLTYRF